MDVSTRSAASEPRDASPVEVTVKGALDAAGVRGLRAVLDQVLARRPRDLVIDLVDCPFLDATAIEVLVDAHRRAWREGGLLTLRDPSPRVRRILEIARVDHVLRLTITPPLRLEPERRGAAEPERRGAAEPERGGAAEPERGGAAEPERGGASEPERGGAAGPAASANAPGPT